jgi:hypothetical protein
MAAQRLFTQAELDALCRPGSDRVLAALESGGGERVKGVFRDVDAAYRQFHEIYHAWVATIFEFVFEKHGHEAVTKAVPLDGALAAACGLGLDAEKSRTMDEAPGRFEVLVDAGDLQGAKRLALEHAKTARDRHDWYRDWVSSLLSHVYRQQGLDGLEQCLRYSSEKGWMPWMMEESHDPATRLRKWTRLLAVGNFATLSIEEDDEKFVIVQERHPITFCDGGVSAYRTHIAVMHTLMPIERIGAAWPAIRCPKTRGEPCTILFYKDSRRADPVDYVRVGKSPVARGA